jgi:hypothetical protein
MEMEHQEMSKLKNFKLTWWVLRETKVPVIHGVRDDSSGQVALCGWVLNGGSRQVKGPKTIAKHKKCVRCEAQINRWNLMQ